MKKYIIYLLSVVAFLMHSCEVENEVENEEDDPTVIIEPGVESSCPGEKEDAVASGQNSVLVWADEFDEDGSVCNLNWSHEIGASGWGNNESQFYTNRLDNSYVEDGVLKIVAKKETFGGASYTSARLVTRNKFSFTYGRVEVRAKLPSGGGTWPAIWTLGQNISTVGWPACGEIDIMEHTGNDQGITSSAIHNSSGHGNTPYVNHRDFDDDVSTEFHVYAINWTADKIEFMVDDETHYTYRPTLQTEANWPFDLDQFLLLNVAMGGTLGGDIDPNFTESVMEVDYVRVYQ